MHQTRTTVKLLVGVAVTALSGCVSVQPQPSAPTRPESSRPAQDLAPQIVQPPARDMLEALPDPKPSPSASRRAAPAPPPSARRDGPRPPQQHRPGPAAHPEPRRAAPPAPVPALPAPVTGAGVCALGRGYGHWPAGSPQARICDSTYGH
ncbi:hypothetical protein ABT025_14375 [Streptomyces sp. NPDC002809]|uniref:hypothetical protein n=1 Tax=Streptomyces sp. NPDC002809 TaxID=3154433 RepID=UPI003320F279